MSRARETALFLTLTLLISWAIGWVWVHSPKHGWLTQWMMCTPAVVGVGLAWLLRREPPRAVGLAFTGAAPWVAALLYPVAMVGAAVALAYAVRAVSGDAGFIRFQPEAVQTGGWLGLPRRPGLGLLWVRLLRNLWVILPWLLVAGVYRLRGPERLAAALPVSLRPLHHGLRWAMFALVVLAYPGWIFAPPGAIGEEVGWRGTLVRRWLDRPRLAALISAPVWAAFHLPVVFAPTQAGHLLQNLVFLASIAAAAPVFVGFYVWSRSLWPCAVLHFSWNYWNPFFLGDVYGGAPAVFGGAVWAFNGEGLFGLIINGAVSLWLMSRFPRQATTTTTTTT